MSSQLNVDTIVDKAGSGGTNVKIANNSTYVGEGGSGTQNTVQGLGKVFALINQQSTQTILDSFNVSSITDFNTGATTITFTNPFSNDAYSNTNGLQRIGTSDFVNNGFDNQTTLCDIEFFSGGTQGDSSKVSSTLHGDLA